MNKVDKYLLRMGFNLDGTKKKNNSFQQEKRNLKTELLIADKKEMQRLKFKKWSFEDRKK